MDKNILLSIKNRYIKNILLKSISKADIGILDVIDADDMDIKIDAYGDSVALAVTEITDDSMNEVKDIVSRLKAVYPSVPVLALVYKDTYDIVNFVRILGINDILFLTKNIETYGEAIQKKMAGYYDSANDSYRTLY